MSEPPFDRDLRAALLTRRAEALAEYERLMSASGEQLPGSAAEEELLVAAEAQQALAREAEQEYFERLPRVTLSCCPVCAEPLARTFDPYGFDGPWWGVNGAPRERVPCAHFCALAGAVDLGDQEPVGGDFAAYLGPGVPYAIPRLLELPGVTLVVSRVALESGCLAYPLAYFAPEVPSAELLTSSWARPHYAYTTPQGRRGWRVPADAWDFELAPWLEQGRLRWCDPEGDRATLAAGDCPYLGLAGPRELQVVQGDRVERWGAPTGRPVVPSWR